MPISPLLPRVVGARRPPEASRRASSSIIDAQLASHGHGDRLDEVLDEVERVRVEAGSPPLAAPLGQIVASQALVNVLGANRYGDDRRRAARPRRSAASGSTPGPIDPALQRAVELRGDRAAAERRSTSTRCARARKGLAASEEELLLLALFGEEAEPLLQSIRRRAGGEEPADEASARPRARRADPLGRADRPGDRASARSRSRRTACASASGAPSTDAGRRRCAPSRRGEPRAVRRAGRRRRRRDGREPDGRHLLPRPRSPGRRRSSRRATRSSPGQVLCILEAMKLMNEVKAEVEAIVRADPRRRRAARRVRPAAVRARAAQRQAARPLMFRRVLVANRGEIAVRVIRALHELGVEAVAVYSTADEGALHVAARRRGGPDRPAAGRRELPAASRRSSPRRSRPAARRCTPATASSSENPAFVEACVDNDLVFVGPARVGDGGDGRQDRGARRRCAAADVPTVPGTEGATTLEGARAAAAEIGYPVMLKAAAGGGGRGDAARRRPGTSSRIAYEAASAEAAAAFGDGTLYLEKVLSPARHVEIQVMCDAHGNVLTLGERECSIQRRHQKLIEEAPSAALTPELREAMEAAAERACRAVGYVNAGTFEFLLGPDGTFSFIELNARLQVEHPVTELCTGIDLVRCQLEVAAGERLRVTGRAPRRGHAIEIRLNAEDPARDFMPAPGHRDPVPAAARARRPGRHLRRGRHGDPAVLRLADRQDRRVGHRPRRGDRPRRAGARGARRRGRADDARALARDPPQRGVPQRRVLDLDARRAAAMVAA